MPREAKPWYRKATNSWWIKLGGRQFALGVSGEANEADALQAWHRLMANGSPKSKPEPTPQQMPSLTLDALIRAFLADAEARVSASCLHSYKHHLQPLAKALGSRTAESLGVSEAESYARQPQWSPTYRANILASLVTAYRWAERSRLIGTNPLQGVRKPPKASRGASAVVSAEAHARLVAHARPTLRAFLELLWLTGARPKEIASLTAEAIDLRQGVAVLHAHKTAHLGKRRVIFFCPKALRLLRRLIAKRPQGLLFSGKDGEPLTCKAIDGRLRRLCKKAGVRHCIPYGYRHGFATAALAKGVPDAQVAALLGHSGTNMLHRHYSHLTAQAQALRHALAGVR